MKIQQVSVFLENKPGQLRTACDVLAKAGLNMVTLSLADTAQFGILRLIVQDSAKAKAVLEKAGYVVKLTEVLALEVADQPGGISRILEIVDAAKLNIEYMYAFTEKRGDRAMLVFRFTNPDQALTILKQDGINPINTVSLFGKG